MVAHFPDGSLKCFLVKVVVRPKDVSMGPERLGRESVKDFFCTSLRKVCEPPKSEFHGISPVKIFHCNPLIHQVIAGCVEKVQLLTLFSAVLFTNIFNVGASPGQVPITGQGRGHNRTMTAESV